MKFTLRGIACVLLLLSLSGCSTFSHSSTFRNRNFDYTREPIQNLPPLTTPPSLHRPEFNPFFNIPPGTNDYAPGAPPNMTPPDFNQNVPLPDQKTESSS